MKRFLILFYIDIYHLYCIFLRSGNYQICLILIFRQLMKASKKQNFNISTFEATRQLLLLFSHLKMAPRIVQDLFAPCLSVLNSLYEPYPQIKQFVNELRISPTQKFTIDTAYMAFFSNYLNILQIRIISESLIKARKACSSNKTELALMIREGRMYKQTAKIVLIRPQYKLTEKIAKSSGVTIKERFQSYPESESLFYAEPRFITKISELNHFRQNYKHKGNILMLEYEGDFIVGSRTYAIIKGNFFQIWEMSSSHHHLEISAKNRTEISQPVIEDVPYINLKNPEFRPVIQEKPRFKKIYTFISHTEKITCASFSADEFYLITGSADRSIKLWCLRLNIMLAQYRSHTRTVWDVDFNQSGYYFLSGSADGMMALWRTDAPVPQRLLAHGGDVYRVAFCKNPSFAVSAGENGYFIIWHLSDAQAVYKIRLINPIININLGHSGKYLITLEADGRVSVHNLLSGTVESSFYYYSKTRTQSKLTRAKILDVCLSEDEQELSCVTSKQVLLYKIDDLLKNRNTNIFLQNNTKQWLPEQNVRPSDGLLMCKSVRVNFCRYTVHGLLVVGAVHHQQI